MGDDSGFASAQEALAAARAAVDAADVPYQVVGEDALVMAFDAGA